MNEPKLEIKHTEETCLHCKLSPIIQSYLNDHPDVEAQDVCGMISQTLGEFVGSWVAVGDLPFDQIPEIAQWSKMVVIGHAESIHGAHPVHQRRAKEKSDKSISEPDSSTRPS